MKHSSVKLLSWFVFSVLLISIFLPSFEYTKASTTLTYVGVNLAGAEFGESRLPGDYGYDYIYPTSEEVAYFFSKGMNVFRVPFRWERLQNSQFAEFNTQELERLDEIVDSTTAGNTYVILDPHNGARYYGDVIGGANLNEAAFANFWQKLASHFMANEKVIFGLMNEPNNMPTEQWRSAANSAIVAIRSTGAKNLILVQGNGYSGAHSWYDSWYGTSNATEMLNITDPIDNFAFDVHQFLDSDSSGTSGTCISDTIGSERLANFTNWLRENDLKGFLTEFAGGRNSTCYAALDNLLSYLNSNSDVWLGWTYWAAGPWWEDYIFTIEPDASGDRPQMDVLENHLFQRKCVFLPAVQKN